MERGRRCDERTWLTTTTLAGARADGRREEEWAYVVVELLCVLPCACVAKTNGLSSPEPPQRLSFATSIVENQTTRLYAPHIARKDQQVFSAMCPAAVGTVAMALLQQMEH